MPDPVHPGHAPVDGLDRVKALQVDDEALACAAELADALPLVMSALRSGLRHPTSDGMSVPQFRCLAFISRQPGTSVTDATAFLGVTMATTSAMVDRLVAAGYVVTRMSPTDRRRAVLTVTAAGEVLVSRMREAGRAEIARALGDLSQAEIQTLRDAAALLQRKFHRG